MTTEYHKIENLYLRDPETNYKTVIEGAYSNPIFSSLETCLWLATEKLDGTNVRIIWDSKEVKFHGRTDRAQLHNNLVKYLESKFYAGSLSQVFTGEDEVVLYGEGLGPQIGPVGYMYGEEQFLTLFDIKVGNYWLEYHDVVAIAKEVQVDVAPVVTVGTLPDIVSLVKKGFDSKYNDNLVAEGVIVTPFRQLFDRKGRRVIAKIKHKDFPQ